MFQFRRFPTYAYLIQRRLTEYCSAGFPHSEISGSTVICTSPKLIAAYHVLHRLLMPRHSPCALLSLTYFLVNKKVGKENFNGLPSVRQWPLLSLLSYSPLYEERSRSGSLSLNYAGFRVWNCSCYPLKVPQLTMFPSVACSSYFGYFVQFSRCGSDLCRNQIQTLSI